MPRTHKYSQAVTASPPPPPPPPLLVPVCLLPSCMMTLARSTRRRQASACPKCSAQVCCSVGLSRPTPVFVSAQTKTGVDVFVEGVDETRLRLRLRVDVFVYAVYA